MHNDYRDEETSHPGGKRCLNDCGGPLWRTDAPRPRSENGDDHWNIGWYCPACKAEWTFADVDAPCSWGLA